MTTKIIYPVLIIIFSILIIFAILQNNNNKKLNNGIEKFMNNYLEYEKNDLKLNLQNNLEITKEFANGTWTFINTTLDSNYNANNLITINIDSIPGIDNSNSKTYGTVKINNDTYVINFISNEIITAVSNSNLIPITLNIKFLNIFSEVEKKNNINPVFKNPDSPSCIISLLIGDLQIFKFTSYKVYNNKVSGEIYKIIKSKDFFINSPPKLWDLNSYNVIIDSYKFPSNIVTVTFGVSNDAIKQKIISSYGGSIKFGIRRVFYSPSTDGLEIITKNSHTQLINVLNGNNIPSNIVIAPFSNDKSENGLDTFFKPKSTILYFYKLTNYNSTYDFGSSGLVNISPYGDTSANSSANGSSNTGNNNIVTIPRELLKFQNNSNNMFNQTIKFSNPRSVEQINNSTFTMTYVTTVNSNLNDPTIIPFSILYDNNLL